MAYIMRGPGGGEAFVILPVLALVVFSVVLYWKIFAKAGYPGALGLLMFIPIVNLVLLCVLAFGHWPIERELERLKQSLEKPQ